MLVTNIQTDERSADDLDQTTGLYGWRPAAGDGVRVFTDHRDKESPAAQNWQTCWPPNSKPAAAIRTGHEWAASTSQPPTPPARGSAQGGV